jgi:hypothetical protein
MCARGGHSGSYVSELGLWYEPKDSDLRILILSHWTTERGGGREAHSGVASVVPKYAGPALPLKRLSMSYEQARLGHKTNTGLEVGTICRHKSAEGISV